METTAKTADRMNPMQLKRVSASVIIEKHRLMTIIADTIHTQNITAFMAIPQSLP